MDANGADDKLKCAEHGENEAAGACAECGKAFCAIEVEKSGQSVYCPDCYNATLDELLEGYERLKAVQPPEAPETATIAEAAAPPESTTLPADKTKSEADPYFALGPDDDFSFFEKGGRKKPASETSKATEEPEAPETPEEVLEDVVATLMHGTAHAAAAPAPAVTPKPGRRLKASRLRKARVDLPASAPAPVGREAQEAQARAAMELARQKALEHAKARREREERWGFLAQPRAVSETRLGSTRPRAALFVIVTGIVALLLWALPNALLIKGDTEYGLHALAIGALVGLALWWRAGRKHSTRLAWEATAITIVSIVLGEMLHWTIVIWKEQFFRTVFDIISFKFFFTHLPSIMGKIFPEMFPLNFIWIIVLPALIAFIIGFGSPPIPEIFGQMWRALRHRHAAEPEGADGS